MILQALAAFQEATGLSRRLRYTRMEAYAPLGLGFYHRFRNEYGPVLAYTQQARQRAGTYPAEATQAGGGAFSGAKMISRPGPPTKAGARSAHLASRAGRWRRAGRRK